MSWNILTWIMEVFSSAFGDLLGTGFRDLLKQRAEGKVTTAQVVGATLGESIRKINEEWRKTREGFLHEIKVINRRTNGGCAAILRLFDELNRNGNVMWIQITPSRRKVYREGWIVRKLRSIHPDLRDAVYPILNDQLDTNFPGMGFFTSLEILHEDEWRQIMREIRMRIEASGAAQAARVVGTTMNDVARDATTEVMDINQQLADFRDRVRDWARR